MGKSKAIFKLFAALILLFGLSLSQIPSAFAAVTNVGTLKATHITISDVNPKPGEKIKFTVDVTGISDPSNISGYLNFEQNYLDSDDSPSGDYEVELNYNDSTGKVEGAYTIPSSKFKGRWCVVSLYLYGDSQIFQDTNIYPDDPLFAAFTINPKYEDLTPPSLISLTRTIDNGKVHFKLTAKDNAGGSGLSNENAYIGVALKGGTIDDSKDVELKKTGSNTYTGDFSIPKYNSKGTWFVSWISFTDNNGNDYGKYLISSTDPLNKKLIFSLKGWHGDRSAPTITSIKVDKKVTKPGDSVHFTVIASDNGGSGINNVGDLVLGLNGLDSGNVSLKSVENNKYTGSFTIPKFNSNGKWTIISLYLSDQLNNESNRLFSENDQINKTASFTVSKSSNILKDTKAPKVSEITVSNRNPVAESTVHFTIKATDGKGGSGLSGFGSIDVATKNVNGKITKKTVYLDRTDASHYSGDLTIPKYNSNGKWAVTHIDLSDNEGNETNQSVSTTSSLNQSAAFNVNGGKTDYVQPKILGFKINNTKAVAGDRVYFTLNVSDTGGSGFPPYDGASVNLKFNNGIINTVTGASLSYYSKNTFYGSFYIPWYNSNGSWQVTGASVQDSAGNAAFYKPKSNQTFNVYGSTVIKPTGLLIDNSYPRAGDVIRIRMKSTISGDTPSRYVLARIARSGTQTNSNTSYADLTYNFLNQDYEGYYRVPKNLPEGTYVITNIIPNGGEVSDELTSNLVSPLMKVFVIDRKEPSKPKVYTFGNNSQTVSGSAEAYSKVTLYYGRSILGTANTSSNGAFAVKLKSKQPAGRVLTVYATDKANNTSSGTTVKVADKTAPGKPVVYTLGNNTAIVTGKAEAGATVTIKYARTVQGSGYVTSKGTFAVKMKSKQPAGRVLTVYAKDKAKNTSAGTTIKVADKTAPSRPSVNKITSKTTRVTGKAEAGSTVYIYAGKKLIGKTAANSKRTFSKKIKKLKKKTKVTILCRDRAGNKSKTTTITVK